MTSEKDFTIESRKQLPPLSEAEKVAFLKELVRVLEAQRQ